MCVAILTCPYKTYFSLSMGERVGVDVVSVQISPGTEATGRSPMTTGMTAPEAYTFLFTAVFPSNL
jgi:hypothetical protein